MDHGVVRAYLGTLLTFYEKQAQWQEAKAKNDTNTTDLGTLTITGLPDETSADVKIVTVGHAAVTSFVIDPLLTKLEADITTNLTALFQELQS